MDFYEVKLSDKDIFNKYLSGRYHELITYNFSNFYLWRNWDPYKWAIIEDALCIKSDYLGLDTVICPCSANDNHILKATETLIEWYNQRNIPFLMSEVSEAMLNFYNIYWPNRFVAEEYRPGFNYIYHRNELATLSGNKFNAKRNHVHRFIKEYPNYRFVPLTQDLVDDCKDKQKKWRTFFNQSDPILAKELEYEEQGVFDALDHLDELDFSGACLIINDTVEAFTIGERLNKDTWCIHIEKGNFEKFGTFQAINQFYAQDYCEDTLFINRAEDMGHEGQRKAKMSYHPYKLAKKYYLRLK